MAAPAGVQQKQSPERVVEELNRLHLQYFNLQWVKSRAITLSETISRVLNDFDAILRTNTFLKWYVVQLPRLCLKLMKFHNCSYSYVADFVVAKGIIFGGNFQW